MAHRAPPGLPSSCRAGDRMVTVMHWTGQIEDLPEDRARALVDSGHAYLVSAYETEMIDPAPERAVLPPARPKRAYKRRKPRGA